MTGTLDASDRMVQSVLGEPDRRKFTGRRGTAQGHMPPGSPDPGSSLQGSDRYVLRLELTQLVVPGNGEDVDKISFRPGRHRPGAHCR